MARREHPRYENMEWREWEYKEYPMMLYPGAEDPRKPEYHTDPRTKRPGLKYPGVIVRSDEELDKVLTGAAEFDAVSGELLTEEDERKALISECELHGIKIDRRWNSDKLQKALDDHIKELGEKEEERKRAGGAEIV